jgi:glycosyltransferase involved in cell wall biosynthesis
MLSPEPPYPLHGGGAYRTASLVHYFGRFADVDLVLLSESGKAADVPAGLLRSQKVIPLAPHGRSPAARYARNARRAIRGVPPLIDRLSGLGPEIRAAVGDRRYDWGIIEHFWCAPYFDVLRGVCGWTILDLHNVESVLHRRCAAASGGLIAAGHRRFAAASRKAEAELLPRFSLVLATSEEDAALVREIAPSAKCEVYPNAIPWVETPAIPERRTIVFSGNFEYHPNIDAVRFLVKEIWPEIRRRRPEFRLRLVGRGDGFIRHLLPEGMGIEATGPVPDAFAEIAAASVVVAPLRTGSGTRVKILEAWAASRAVVATPLAAEGLKADDGGNLLLRSEPTAFAAAVDGLLADPVRRQRLGAAGRHIFRESYTWDVAWSALDLKLQVTRAVELNRYTE